MQRNFLARLSCPRYVASGQVGLEVGPLFVVCPMWWLPSRFCPRRKERVVLMTRYVLRVPIGDKSPLITCSEPICRCMSLYLSAPHERRKEGTVYEYSFKVRTSLKEVARNSLRRPEAGLTQPLLDKLSPLSNLLRYLYAPLLNSI